MKFASIKFKMAALYTAILGIILIIYSGILYLDLRHTLYSEIDKELKAKAYRISNTLSSCLDLAGDDEGSFAFVVQGVIGLGAWPPDKREIKELEQQWLQAVDKLDLGEDCLNFMDSQGESLASSRNLRQEEILSLFLKKKTKEEGFRNIRFGKRNLRIISLPFTYKGHKGDIQVGTSLEPAVSIMKGRFRTLVISIPVALVLTSFIGRFLAIRILRPVEDITKTASRITHEDLSARVKVEGLDEEMKHLASAFNEMILRLENSFKHVAEFSSHVAHELKTPLAIIRGESEVALRRERSIKEYQRVIGANLEETERMVKTINDLLLLAKLDYRPEVFKFEQFDLIPFFKEIYEQSKILAAQKDIAVTLGMPEEPIDINADRLHLRRLFFNLIHNAIKFNSPGGKIDIAINLEDKSVLVSVSDTGVGIAKEDLPKVFDRFFYRETAPADSEPSNGLGLSIAQSIAGIHHGRIKVESQPQKGSTFTVTLPLS
ncbi:HAMP domain-containing protein [bacterium]|nr:HAMP domain-containing protein [bacterium]